MNPHAREGSNLRPEVTKLFTTAAPPTRNLYAFRVGRTPAPGNKRSCTALAGIHMLYPLSYGRICIRPEGFEPSTLRLRSNSVFTTGKNGT